VNSEQKRRCKRIAIFLLVLSSNTLLAANNDTNIRVPPHVFVDAGGCPIECCKYGHWVVGERTALLDRPNGKRVVNSLSKGDVVNGLTGQVISTPMAAKADRDIPDTPIKKGDTFYVLHYSGEGYWKVWFRGKMTYAPDYGRLDFPRTKSEWWVKIKDSDGKIGWALQHGNFSDQHPSDQDVCE
jgi:hypothetical protein